MDSFDSFNTNIKILLIEEQWFVLVITEFQRRKKHETNSDLVLLCFKTFVGESNGLGLKHDKKESQWIVLGLT